MAGQYDDFLKDYVWLIAEHKVTKEEFLSIVFALRNAYPYISPSEFVELIKKYGEYEKWHYRNAREIPVLMTFMNLARLINLIKRVSG